MSGFGWTVLELSIQSVGLAATLAIGWAALKIAGTQAKAALFDRRFNAYRDLSAGMAQMAIEGAVYHATFNGIKEAIHLSRFLYDKATVARLDELLNATYSAWLLRPLENRGRSGSDHEKADGHMSEMDRLWSLARPAMERSLRTWQR